MAPGGHVGQLSRDVLLLGTRALSKNPAAQMLHVPLPAVDEYGCTQASHVIDPEDGCANPAEQGMHVSAP